MQEDEIVKVVEDAVAGIQAHLADGFQIADVFGTKERPGIFPLACQAAEKLSSATGPEKKAVAMRIADSALDKFDLPGPDWATKKAIMFFAPYLIDWFVDTARGKLGLS